MCGGQRRGKSPTSNIYSGFTPSGAWFAVAHPAVSLPFLPPCPHKLGQPSSPGAIYFRRLPLQTEMMQISRLMPCICTSLISRAESRSRRNRSAASFEHQFQQDNLPFVTAKELVVVLGPVFAAPVEDGRHPAAEEGGALGRGKSTSEASKGAALAVLDPPMAAITCQRDGVAWASGGDGCERRVIIRQPACERQIHKPRVGRRGAVASSPKTRDPSRCSERRRGRTPIPWRGACIEPAKVSIMMPCMPPRLTSCSDSMDEATHRSGSLR